MHGAARGELALGDADLGRAAAVRTTEIDAVEDQSLHQRPQLPWGRPQPQPEEWTCAGADDDADAEAEADADAAPLTPKTENLRRKVRPLPLGSSTGASASFMERMISMTSPSSTASYS